MLRFWGRKKSQGGVTMSADFKRADEILIEKIEKLDNEIKELWKQLFRMHATMAEIQARLIILKEWLK